MQIRYQGKNSDLVQCIRIIYDSVTKTSKGKLLFSFKKEDGLKQDETYLAKLKMLTDAEKAQLDTYMKSIADGIKKDDSVWRVGYCAGFIKTAVEAIDLVGVNAEQANAIHASIELLLKSLKAAGHPKPARPKKIAPVAPNADQATLNLPLN